MLARMGKALNPIRSGAAATRVGGSQAWGKTMGKAAYRVGNMGKPIPLDPSIRGTGGMRNVKARRNAQRAATRSRGYKRMAIGGGVMGGISASRSSGSNGLTPHSSGGSTMY